MIPAEPPMSPVKRLFVVSAVLGALSLCFSCLVGGILEFYFTQDDFSAPSLDQQTHLGPLIVALGASIVTAPGLIFAIIATRKSTRRTNVLIAILIFLFCILVLGVNIAIWSADAFTPFEVFYL